MTKTTEFYGYVDDIKHFEIFKHRHAWRLNRVTVSAIGHETSAGIEDFKTVIAAKKRAESLYAPHSKTVVWKWHKV